MRVILASASPRRAELLRAAGFEFEIVAADVDERVRDGETPDVYVRRLAQAKSGGAVSDAIVIGADTAVVVDGAILGKPIDDADAARMLKRLSGRTHDVLTGVSVRLGTHELSRVETTRVEFAPLTDADIAWYVSSGEGRDKAGAYAIQGLASRFIPRIDGSYSNVVGLPIAGVAELLATIRKQP
jgi:septum formation protein